MASAQAGDREILPGTRARTLWGTARPLPGSHTLSPGSLSAKIKATAALFLIVAALFLILNRGAYKSYFQDDELDNISWTPYPTLHEWVTAFITPRFDPYNFRPTGHLYFSLMARRFGLDFPKYLIPLHAMHLFNALLIWLLARRLKAGWLAAAAAMVFFALNVAAFDAYWKPMYIFDVLCASFCLASILLFARGRWILSLLAFWLAYKAKELAVMLPLVLAAYEFWFGQRRWKPLVPFFLISLSFGLQGILLNPNKDNNYTFRFSLQSWMTTIPFYSSRLLLVPFGGLALLALALLRDRRVWFGLAAMCLFFFPLLFLPGRLYPAYCYLPLTGTAIAIAGLVSIGERARWRPLVPVLFLVLAIWIPWNIRELRIDRRATLAAGDEGRAFVTAIQDYARSHPRPPSFVYEGAPRHYAHWGVTAAVHIAYNRLDLPVVFSDTPEGKKALDSHDVALIKWDARNRRVHFITRGGSEEESYIKMDYDTPPWQLASGWLGLSDYFQWIEPRAVAYLRRPADARRFELVANISPELIRKQGSVTVTVRLNGAVVGERKFTAAGHQKTDWPAPPAAAGDTRVDFEVYPEFTTERDHRRLGIAIISFGFLP